MNISSKSFWVLLLHQCLANHCLSATSLSISYVFAMPYGRNIVALSKCIQESKYCSENIGIQGEDKMFLVEKMSACIMWWVITHSNPFVHKQTSVQLPLLPHWDVLYNAKQTHHLSLSALDRAQCRNIRIVTSSPGADLNKYFYKAAGQGALSLCACGETWHLKTVFTFCSFFVLC